MVVERKHLTVSRNSDTLQRVRVHPVRERLEQPAESAGDDPGVVLADRREADAVERRKVREDSRDA